MGIRAQFSCRFFFLTITCVLWAVGCGLCGNEIGYEEYSPDRKLKAVVFERDCGATTGFSTQVSLLGSAEKLPNEAGNVFTADGDLRIRVQWQSNSEILVKIPLGAKVHLKQSRVAGISVRYEE
jgi:hypothetical protein